MSVLALRQRLMIGLALAVLMAITRGQHFASLDALPSASWAVFFLAGVYLRAGWGFAALFVEASLLDLAALQGGQVTDWCLSPAYWALLPAYACLWGAGRLFAQLARGEARDLLRLAALVCGAALCAYLISGGGFYFLSGHYPQADLAGFVTRIASYYPRQLGNLALYLVAAAILHLSLGLLALQRREALG